jgi:hypothetical protein
MSDSMDCGPGLHKIFYDHKSRRMRWADHAAGMGGGEQNAYKKMAVKPERKTLLGRSRRTCEYNIEMNITKKGMN